MSMDDSEIMAFIKEIFSINLPRDCFSRPNPETIIGIYEMLLMELGVENWQQPDLTAIANIDNLERFDDFFGICNLANCLRYLLTSMGCQEVVTVADLVNPQPKKSKRIMTRLIQLWGRLNDIKAEWEPIAQTKFETERNKEEILARNESLKQEYAQKSMVVAQGKPAYNAMTKKLDEISEQHTELKMKGEKLAEEYRVIKQTMTEKKAVLCEMDVKLGEKREELAALESKVVKSPEKVMAEVESKEKELEAKRNESRKYQKDYMESIKKLDMIEEAIRDMNPSINRMKETFEDLNAFREKAIEREATRSKIETKKQELSGLRVVADQNETNLKQLKDQQRKTKIQHENKKRPLNDMNEEIKHQIQQKQESGASKDHHKYLEKERVLTNQHQELKLNREKFDANLNSNCEKAVKIVANMKKEVLNVSN